MTRPQASPNSRVCRHPIPPTLARKLPDPHRCPVCTIADQIGAVREVQQELESRDGVFISKIQGHRHATLKKQWSKAKIALSNTLITFEELVMEKQLPAEDLIKIEEALCFWEDRSISLTRVPGVTYAKGAKEQEPTEEDHQFAQLMMQYLETVLENEMTPEDKVAVAERFSMESAQQERVEWKDRTAEQKLPVLSAPPKTPHKTPTPTSQTPQVAQIPESILKRSASLTPSPLRKRVRLAETVTISPECLNISNPSPFTDLTRTSTLQEHRRTTTAENRRRRSGFWRPSPLYEPGAWASGGFESKANTSYYKAEWESMEQEKQREEEEVEEEKRVVEGLKLITGVWMGMWWVKNIMRHLDLEKVIEEAETK
jgi:hypothetical protein